MKRGFCVVLLFWVLLAGCGSVDEKKRIESLETNPTYVVTVEPTREPLLEDVKIPIPTISPETFEEVIMPIIVTPPAVPDEIIPKGTEPPVSSVENATPTPVAVTEPIGLDFLKIGMEPYLDEDGRLVYEAPTCFLIKTGYFVSG